MVKTASAVCAGALLALAAPAAAAGESQAALAARIEVLERRIVELERRLQALEAPRGAAVPPALATAPPSPGQWRDPASWSFLKGRMTKEEVLAILGAPEETKTVGKFEYWYYGAHKVVLYLGRVDSWQAP